MLLMVTITEVIGLTFFFIFAVIFCYHVVKLKIKRTFCFHKNYHENMACQAICDNCGKNLGFIGNIRDKKA